MGCEASVPHLPCGEPSRRYRVECLVVVFEATGNSKNAWLFEVTSRERSLTYYYPPGKPENHRLKSTGWDNGYVGFVDED